MTKTNTILLHILVLVSSFSFAQHSRINCDTITFHGTTDTSDHQGVLINTDGNIVLTGNQKMSSTQYDATTSAQTASASVAWVNSFNTSSLKFFVVSSSHDAAGNIYNVGSARTTTSSGFDWLVMKLNSTGTVLWSRYYNGSANGDDAAVALTIDNANNCVYVTGVADASYPMAANYMTIKYAAATGNTVWATPYNYSSGYMDVPTGISIAGSQVIVSGSSGTSFNKYDFCTVSYNTSTGAQNSVVRTNNPNAYAQDKVLSVATDPFGNVFTCGTTLNSSGNYDLKIQKLDTTLTILWTKTFGGPFDQAGINLDVDDSLNVYITGSTFVSSTQSKILLVKYDKNGNEKWAVTPEITGASSAQGLRLICKKDNEIFIGGNVVRSGNQDIFLMRYNKNGDQTLCQYYNGPANNMDKFMDFTLDTLNHIYLSARTYTTSTLDANILVQYHYEDVTLTPATSTVTGAHYAANQLMVTFNKKALKMTAINNKGKTFGVLNDFVSDSTCNKITTLLDPDRRLLLNSKTWATEKIFLDMTDADTLSQSRMGDYVKVPPFYCKLLVKLPSSLNTENTATQLATIKPDVVRAQLNFVYSLFWVPNDSLYAGGQTSLHTSTLYPNAHIKCEQAWNYTKGSSFVRVGIYDTGIEAYHSDVSPAVLATIDYINLGQGGADLYGHGTLCAGVIGAKSNNNQGIAGIAGGDATATGTANTGASLCNVKIFEPGGIGLAASSVLVAAYKTGADGTNIGGLALNIGNHSYGRVDHTYDADLQDGINYMNANGVAFVAARGNKRPTDTWPLNQYSAPACLSPGKVLNIGASGTNGHTHINGANGSAFTSLRCDSIDVIAPGDGVNVTTTIPYPTNPRTSSTSSLAPQYSSFAGTSASAPHVAGVAALMMSSRNSPTPVWDNLVHEDCEALIKRTATDLALGTPYFEQYGYDTLSGYGRINADSAVHAVQPQYHIRHIDKTHYASSFVTTTTTVQTNQLLYYVAGPTSTVPTAVYYTDVIKVQTVYSLPYGSETYLTAWPLYKASSGYIGTQIAANVPVSDPSNVELTGASLTSATVQTYVYKLKNSFSTPSFTLNTFVPNSPSNINSAFTLYTVGGPLSIKQEVETHVDYFNVYPNPSNGQMTVGFNSKKDARGNLKVLDIMGNVVYEYANHNFNYGLNSLNLTLTGLPQGIYFVNLEMEGNKHMVKKIIIE